MINFVMSLYGCHVLFVMLICSLRADRLLEVYHRYHQLLRQSSLT